VADGSELAVLLRGERDLLRRTWAMTHAGEHLATGERELHRFADYFCRHRRTKRVRPLEPLAAKTTTDERTNHTHVFARQAERRSQARAGAHDPLRGVVDRQLVPLPSGDGAGELH